MAQKTVIERLVVQLCVDNSHFNKGIKSLQKSLSRASSSMIHAGKRMSKIMIGGLVAIGVAALKLGRDYDWAMNRVQAVTNATTKDMSKLNDTAQMLGRTTARTAIQIAEGMATLGLAGFSIEDIDASIAAITSLSVIADVDLKTAAQDAANLMAQFDIAATDLTSAVDILARTATSSNQTVEELVNGLKFAGPIAHQAGMGLAETAAAMGILANNGIRAGIAGRALRMGILKIVAPTSEASEKLRQLGVSVTDEEGNLVSFEEQLRNVNEGLEGMGDMERMATLRVLYGTRALGPMNILLKEQAEATEDGSNAFAAYFKELEEGELTAATMEEMLLQGLPGAMIYFKSASQGALLKLRELFNVPVITLLWSLTNLINKFSDMQKGTSVIMDYITNWSRLEDHIGIVVGVIRNKIDDFMDNLFGLKNATQIVVDFMVDKWESFKDTLNDVFGIDLEGEMVQKHTMDEEGNMVPQFDEAGEPIMERQMTQGVILDIMLLTAAIGPLLIIFGLVVGVIGKLVGILTLFSSAVGLVLPVFATVAAAVVTILNPFTGIVAALLLIPTYLLAAGVAFTLFTDENDVYTSRLVTAWDNVKEAFIGLYDAIMLKIPGLQESFVTLWDKIGDSGVGEVLRETTTTIVEVLSGFVVDVLESLTSLITDGFEPLNKAMEETDGWFKILIETIKNIIIDFDANTLSVLALSLAIGGIVTAIVPALSSFSLIGIAIETAGVIISAGSLLVDGLALAWSGLVLAFSGAGTLITSIGTGLEIIAATAAGTVAIVLAIVAAVMGLLAGFVYLADKTGEFTDRIDESFKKLKDKFFDLLTVFDPIIEIVKEFIDLIVVEFTEGKIGEAIDNFASKFDPLVEALSALWTAMKDVFKNVWDWVLEFFTEAATIAFEAISFILQFLLDGIKTVIDGIVDVLVTIYDIFMEYLYDPVVDIVTGVINTLSGVITIITGIVEAITALFTWDGNAAIAAWQTIVDGFTEAWEGFKDIIAGMGDFIIGVFEIAFGALITGLIDIGTWIGDLFKKIFAPANTDIDLEGVTVDYNSMLPDISQIKSILGFVTGIWDGLTTGLTTAKTTITNIFDGLFGDDGTITEQLNKIMDFFTGIGPKLAEGFSSAFDAVLNGIITAINVIIDGMNLLLPKSKEIAHINEVGGAVVPDSVTNPTWIANKDVIDWSEYKEPLGSAPFPGAKWDPWAGEWIPYRVNYSEPKYLASGGYFKAGSGGIHAVIGEGKDDEVVAPLPMLQKLLRDAIEASRAGITDILNGNNLMKSARESLGTVLTPMTSNQQNTKSRGDYNVTNNNTFSLDGDITQKVQEALRRQEVNAKLRMGGFRP